MTFFIAFIFVWQAIIITIHSLCLSDSNYKEFPYHRNFIQCLYPNYVINNILMAYHHQYVLREDEI